MNDSLNEPDSQAFEQQQRKAMQEFMLSGGGGSSSKKKNKQGRKQVLVGVSSPSSSSRTPTSATPLRPITSSLSSTTLRHYKSMLQAFYSCLSKHWLVTDDQLGQCVSAIANLRERIWISSRALQRLQDDDVSGGLPGWKRSGFRQHGSNVGSSLLLLTREDLELTLTDELLQQERMLVMARRWMAQMAQEQEAMGRRLDDLLVFQSELAGLEHAQSLDFAASIDECQQIFVATSQELYRKQKLLQELINSMRDGILDSGKRHVEEGASPRRVARKCVDLWPRTSPESCLQRYLKLIERVE
jgi:hypothetical protein